MRPQRVDEPSRRSTVKRSKAKSDVDRARFEDPQFLTIDLDVRSRRSLAPLVAAWPWSYLPPAAENRREPRWLILRPRRSAWPRRNADTAAKELLEDIQGLRGEARRSWKLARLRVFDIGVQAGAPGRIFEEVQLTPATLRGVADVGADVKVTVYPAQPQSSPRPVDAKPSASARSRRKKPHG